MRKIILGVVIVTILGAGGWYFFIRRAAPVQYEYAAVKKGDLVQEVSVTGKVKPAEAVDLAFEKSGKVARVGVDVGDKVKAGQVLAELDGADAATQIAQAEAALESARAKLAELKRGAREEELRVAETKVANAESSLADARLSLENARKKSDADIKDDYDGALTAATKSSSVALHALFTITDIQSVHFSSYDEQSLRVSNAKAEAVAEFLGVSGAGRAGNDYLSQSDGGARLAVENIQNNPTNGDIDGALAQLKKSLQKIKSALDAVPLIPQLTSTETTNLNTEKSNIAGELSAISGKQQAIAVQKTANQNAIDAAQTGVNAAASALKTAQDELTLKEAGTSAETISAQEAQVKEAEAQVRAAQVQSVKLVLRSPLDGIVTKQNVKVGEIVSANAPMISVISGNNFEMEANIPEADIAKVKIGDVARVTLDAYGGDVFFEAKVSSIDPAETMIEGVATYKTTLVFTKDDARVKSGMTANIDIETDHRAGVVLAPQRAVVRKSGSVFIYAKDAAGKPREQEVKLGLVGSDGNVEVIEGLKEGDRIITSPEKLAK